MHLTEVAVKKLAIERLGLSRSRLICAVLGLAGSMGVAYAQTPGDVEAAARQAERLQNDAIERIKHQREQDIQSDVPPTRLQVPTPQPKVRESGVCKEIRTLSIMGVTLLDKGKRDELAEPYVGKCLGVAEIEKLLADVTSAYIAKGYVAARAYLPAQDLNSGVLKVEVEEGRVEKISIKDGDQHSISIGNVAPGVVGEPLNLRDLEQAMDQINRLASNNATMAILPGTAPGDSVVEFDNQPSRTVHLNLTYDNYGQKATGQNEAGVNVGLDNLLGFNDFLSLTHRRAQPYETGREASYFNNLTYVLPLGYNTLSFNASKSEYHSLLDAPSGTQLKTRGDSEIYSFRLDRMIWRGQQSQWSLSGTLSSKESNNYLEDVLLDVSSRKLTVFDFDSTYTTHVLGGSLSADLGVSRGLGIMGGLKDASNLPEEAPRAQFTTYKYGLTFYRPFQFVGKNLTLTSQLNGQHALDTLYGSEQMSIGSPYTVRGFNEETLSGDDGYYLHNDVSLNQPLVLGGHPMILRPYVGLDYGKVWNRVAGDGGASVEGEMTSASLGLGLFFSAVSADLTLTHPINEPAFVGSQGDTAYFSLSLSI